MAEIKIRGDISGSTTIKAPDSGSDEVIELSSALASKLDLAGGKILQVVQTAKTDTFSSSQASGGSVAITGLSCSITPSSASNKVLVQVMVHANNGAEPGSAIVVKRDGTAVGVGAAEGSRRQVSGSGIGTSTAGWVQGVTAIFVDSPSTTSATTYTIDIINMSVLTRTLYVNRSPNDTNSDLYPRAASYIILSEVSA